MVPQKYSNEPVYHSLTLFTITKRLSDLTWMEYASAVWHSSQFNNELVSWTAFILDVNSKPKKLSNQIVNKPEHCLHSLLPTAREQTVTDRLQGRLNQWAHWARAQGPRIFFI